MINRVTHHAQLASHGVIFPAQDVLTFEHHFDRDYMTSRGSDRRTGSDEQH